MKNLRFLQSSRYRLKDELMAFEEGANYQDLIQEFHSDKICEKVTPHPFDDFEFEMKIQLLDEKLKKVLKDYRETLKKQVNN